MSKSQSQGGFEEISIKMAPELAMQAINDQAKGLVDAIKEGYQNGIDALDSTRVEGEVTERYTNISDDGEGMDLTEERAKEILSTLAKSPKRDDQDTIGRFGIGRGQMWAMGVVKMVSGQKAAVFNVKEWGLDARIYDIPTEHAVDGMSVTIYYHRDKVPGLGSYRWQQFEDRIAERLKYVNLRHNVEILLNGEKVDKDISEVVDESKDTATVRETDVAYYALEVANNGKLEVHSNGIKVADKNGDGLSGVIVSKSNMDLVYNRSDVKDGCEVWKDINEELDDFRLELFPEVSSRNTFDDDARSKIAEMALTNDVAREEFGDIPVFQTSNDSEHVSINGFESRGEVGFTQSNNVTADKVHARGKLVLNEEDQAVRVLKKRSSNGDVEMPPEFDVGEMAEKLGVNKGYERLHDADLSSRKRLYIGVARRLASDMGIYRDIKFGEDEDAMAWTDGSAYIVLTEDVFSGPKLEWLPRLRETLVHEWAHTSDSCESQVHGSEFNRRFREKLESTEHTWSDFVEDVNSKSLRDVARLGKSESERRRITEMIDTLETMEEGQRVKITGKDAVVEYVEFNQRDQVHVLEGAGGGEYCIRVASERSWPTVRRESSESWDAWDLKNIRLV